MYGVEWETLVSAQIISCETKVFHEEQKGREEDEVVEI